MGKISELDTVISDLRTTSATIKDVADTLSEMFGSKNEEPQLTLPEVRAILADKSRAGFTIQVKEMLRKHGSEKLSGIDPGEYASLAKDVEGIGNG